MNTRPIAELGWSPTRRCVYLQTSDGFMAMDEHGIAFYTPSIPDDVVDLVSVDELDAVRAQCQRSAIRVAEVWQAEVNYLRAQLPPRSRFARLRAWWWAR